MFVDFKGRVRQKGVIRLVLDPIFAVYLRWLKNEGLIEVFAYICLANDKRSVIFHLLINPKLFVNSNLVPNRIIEWIAAIPSRYFVLADTLKHHFNLGLVLAQLFAHGFWFVEWLFHFKFGYLSLIGSVFVQLRLVWKWYFALMQPSQLLTRPNYLIIIDLYYLKLTIW